MAKLIPKLGVNSKPAGECLCPGRHAQADGQPENIIPPTPYIYMMDGGTKTTMNHLGVSQNRQTTHITYQLKLNCDPQ